MGAKRPNSVVHKNFNIQAITHLLNKTKFFDSQNVNEIENKIRLFL